MAKEASSTPILPKPQASRKRKLESLADHQVTTSNDTVTPSATSNQTSQAPLFTQCQFALALCLQKSKPLELSTEDYILQLRKRIKIGRGVVQDRHIDTAEFWKDQYEKLLAEKTALEQKVFSFGSKDQSSAESMILESANDMAELSYKSYSSINLLRQIQILVKQLADANIDAPTMLRSLQTTLSQMSSLVTQVCESRTPRLKDSWIEHKEQIEGAIYTVGLAYHQCLQAFNHLCRDIPGRQNKTIVIHSFSTFFSEILGHLHRTCELRVQHSTRADESFKPFEKNPTSKAFSTMEYLQSVYDIISMSLSKFLVVMITSNNLSGRFPGHIEILEGYFFHLLQDTGETLSEVVFLEQVSFTNTNKYKSKVGAAKTEPDAVARAKGPYLVYILEKVMKNNPTVMQMLNDKPRRVNTFTHGKKIKQGELSADAKQRLQHTLLKSVFGDDDFPNALKEPSSPELDSHIAVVEQTMEPEEFSTEWFIESLWSLIGWDIFSEEK